MKKNKRAYPQDTKNLANASAGAKIVIGEKEHVLKSPEDAKKDDIVVWSGV